MPYVPIQYPKILYGPGGTVIPCATAQIAANLPKVYTSAPPASSPDLTMQQFTARANTAHYAQAREQLEDQAKNKLVTMEPNQLIRVSSSASMTLGTMTFPPGMMIPPGVIL